MVLKWLNSESNTIVSAATVIAVLSLVSRFVGLIRDRILAGAFGAGPVLDAYYAAFKIPDFFFKLIVVGSLSASFIPLFTKHYRKRKNNAKAWKFTNNVLHVVVAAFIAICGVLFVFAEPASTIVAPGFGSEQQAMTAQFMRVMLLAQVLLGVSMVYGSALQGLKRFFLYSLAPILYNVGIIAGAVWLSDWLGPIGLAWGVVLGAFLHAVVQYFGVRGVGYRYGWSFDFRDEDTREMLRMTGPRVLGLAMTQVTFILFTMIASLLAVGSVTVFQFAYNIQFFPVGIIGVSYAIAAFPSFSEYFENDKMEAFRELFSRTIRQMIFLMTPMMLVFLILRAQIVRVVVGAGRFDWAATIATADTLAFFALSFVAQGLVYVVARAFFALHDTKTPLVASVVAAIAGVGSAWFLTGRFGVAGLGAAYSIFAFVNVLLLWVPLRRRVGTLVESRIWRTILIAVVAGVFSGITIQYLKPVVVGLFGLETFLGVLLQGLFAGGAGLLVYIAVSYFLNSEELEELSTGLRSRLMSKFEPSESIPNE